MKNAKKYIFGVTTYYTSHRVAAFTLVELLVVIAIIALLLSVLMPALGRVREQGKRLVCASNQKQLALAMNIYADQNKGHYPALMKDKDVQSVDNMLAWNPADLMKDSVGADNKTMLWRCPVDDGKGIWARAGYGDPKYTRSYSANGYIVGALNSIPQINVRSVSQTILFSENWTGFGAHRQEGFTSISIWDKKSREGDKALLHDAKKKSRSNYSFVDGHVDFLTWRQVSPTGASGEGMYKPYPNAR